LKQGTIKNFFTKNQQHQTLVLYNKQ